MKGEKGMIGEKGPKGHPGNSGPPGEDVSIIIISFLTCTHTVVSRWCRISVFCCVCKQGDIGLPGEPGAPGSAGPRVYIHK